VSPSDPEPAEASASPADSEASPAGDQPRRHRRLSVVLGEIAADETRERISIADLIWALRDRAFGALMFLFAVPNVLPTPPGTSYILGAPLLFLTLQLMLGRPAPWLPKVIADRSMTRANFQGLIGRALPWLARVERLTKPRLVFLTNWSFERFVGLICFILAVILFLPIPLGNIFPAFAICLFSLAILERDGVFTLLGFAAAIFAITIVSGLIYGVVEGTIFLIKRYLTS
jgi:hypothetical protein